MMIKPNRLGTTLTAIGLVGALAACTTTGHSTAMRGTTAFGGKVDTANIGLATRAQAALAANDVATATDLAERAVEHSPNDAGFRTLLGNCYLAAGRFASAEAAYTDSLTLIANQPQVALKLALTQIALGKNDAAVALLSDARGMLDSSDIGLALALAGRPDDAVALLEPAARGVGADAQLRQNLALAYALGGNWDAARTVAAQDVPADQLDARLQQWMALAKPGQSNTKVAQFIGITPAASDPGQPTRLALGTVPGRERLAAAQPVVAQPAPQPVAPPAPVMAEAAPEPVVAPSLGFAPVETAATEPAPAPAYVPQHVAAPTPVAAPKRAAPVKLAAAPVRADIATPRPALTPAAVRLSQSLPEIRRAVLRTSPGRSRAVVQLGAYSSRDRIAAAWSNATARFGALRAYQPVTARFDGAKGTVYRLSVHGFDSDRQAINLCSSLKRAGRGCFVRAASGDAPVQFASR